MNTQNTDSKPITITATEAEQPEFVKRIGKTTYKVKVYFNPNSKETITDKIIRMLRSEVSKI